MNKKIMSGVLVLALVCGMSVQAIELKKAIVPVAVGGTMAGALVLSHVADTSNFLAPVARVLKNHKLTACTLVACGFVAAAYAWGDKQKTVKNAQQNDAQQNLNFFQRIISGFGKMGPNGKNVSDAVGLLALTGKLMAFVA
ncbi:MAG: hypothetical protein UU47_C0014G0031 [candidate division TM6 bacterium GW2011_GWE2_41_16]|nr:MAG: hypothetical protein UU47_C0014G0031 [candidate division TM6 bacterium GW2011_GWE2_41_16]